MSIPSDLDSTSSSGSQGWSRARHLADVATSLSSSPPPPSPPAVSRGFGRESAEFSQVGGGEATPSLKFWYVDHDGRLVLDKDSAAVTFNGKGSSKL